MYKRVLEEASYLTKTNETIREVANVFNISKSTVHKDLKERLPLLDKNLSKKVDETLYIHLQKRHIKGGESTRLKYKNIKWVSQMKKSNIIFLIYNNFIYLKKDDKFDRIKIDKEIISKGGINNISYLIKSLKKSIFIKESILKIVSDNYKFIYFGDYNDYELNILANNFKDLGFNISFIDFKDLLNDKNDFIFYSDNYFYTILNNRKYIISKDIFSLFNLSTNSNIVVDKYSEDFIKDKPLKARLFIVDNAPNYLLNLIC